MKSLTNRQFADVHGSSILESIREVGITGIEAVQSARVFLIEADFDTEFANRVAREILTDPVCEQYYIGRSKAPAGLAKATLIEVHLKSGVTDPVAESVVTAIADMGIKSTTSERRGNTFCSARLNTRQIETITKKVLANDCIEEVVIGDEAEPPTPHLKPYELKIVHLPIRDLNDEQLLALSKE